MKAQVLLGNNGRNSVKAVFPNVTNPELSIVMRSHYVKTGREYYKIYSNRVTDKFEKVLPAKLKLAPIVIRWGTQAQLPIDGIVYNSSKALARASNKKIARDLFIQNNVPCPAFVTPDTLSFPCIARPFHHHAGQNFVILNNRDEFMRHYQRNNREYYYSAFINKDKEFRVHCAHGKILEMMEKPNPGNGIIAWNLAVTDMPFVRVERKKYNYEVCKVAVEALQALELDFGGVDIITKDKNAYVLEVNTSPNLENSPHVASKYAMYFDWLSRKNEKREHFNTKEYKKGKSFTFWNSLLLDRTSTDKEEE